MRKLLLLLLFFFSVVAITAQGLNKLDEEGKKQGRWELYYNQYWKVLKDSTNAVYYWYTEYDHGKRVYTEAQWGRKSFKFQDSLFSKQEGKIKLLDGKYTWYDKKGNISSVHVFKNGNPVWWKQYHPNGKIYLYFDYIHKCEDEPLSWCLYIYDKKGELKYTSWVSKGCGGTWTNIW